MVSVPVYAVFVEGAHGYLFVGKTWLLLPVDGEEWVKGNGKLQYCDGYVAVPLPRNKMSKDECREALIEALHEEEEEEYAEDGDGLSIEEILALTT